MIELQNVSKSFAGQSIIGDLSLAIPKGKTHVILGSSGCGKTTLLRMICGLVCPDAGDVFIDGRPINDFPRRELCERMGYVVQEGGLLPHMSGRQNIHLPAKVRGHTGQEIDKRIEKLARMMELELHLLDKFPHKLSGGQRQRMALIRGLILDPDIVLLDEPLSALDPVVRMKLQVQLKRIFSELGKSVVLVTHDLHVASYLGDTITLLDKGSVVQSGTFKDMLVRPKNDFVRDFVSSQIPAELAQ